METLYLTHPACKLHDMGDWHPESPQRLDAINDQLLASGLHAYLSPQDAPRASREALARVHDPAYLVQLLDGPPIDGTRTLDPDTLQGPDTAVAALPAAGAGIAAVDAVLSGQAPSAFCAVRPPGHHACRARAMGFCFLNNVSVAVLLPEQRFCRGPSCYRRSRIDAGGDHRFRRASWQRHRRHSGGRRPGAHVQLFPKPALPELRHRERGRQYAQCARAVVRELGTHRWLPRLDTFRPQLILFSAGFDAHREDEMGQMGLVEADYAWLTEQIMAVADRHAQGRAISMLEGGYDLSALGRSVVAHVRALAKL